MSSGSLSHEHSQPLCMKMVPNVRQPPAIRRLGLKPNLRDKAFAYPGQRWRGGERAGPPMTKAPF
jgi:hypothetical protein